MIDLVQATSCMGKHGVDLARIGRQIHLSHHMIAIILRDLMEQSFKVIDVIFNSFAELALALIFAANFVRTFVVPAACRAAV